MRQGRRANPRARLHLAAVGFILPALIIYALFVLYPLIVSLWGSLFQWRGIRTMGFVGLGNFARLFVFPNWPRFSGAFWHNVAWFVGIMIFQNAVGLVFAYLLFWRKKFGLFLQSVFFFPAVLSPVIVGALWRLLLAPNGLVEWLLNGAGLHEGRLTVLSDGGWALWVLTAIDAWNWMGLPVLIFAAGLRQISFEVFEAARLDGANTARILGSIALPLLVPSISSVTILTFINSFNQFDIVYVMEGVAGNPNFATDTLVTYFYRLAFGSVGSTGITDIGLALALGTVLFLIVTLGSIALLRGFDRATVRQ
jgi:raffinose/stachyose/melibiose transport system permease protein